MSMDALLLANRDLIRGAGLGYGQPQCEIMPDEKPKPGCGNIFVSIHQGGITNESTEHLEESFAFGVTLSMRIRGIPLDRVGDMVLAKKVADDAGFNRRTAQLRAILHKSWNVIGRANQILLAMYADADQVWGFCEPAIFRSMDRPTFKMADWYSTFPEQQDIEGIAATLSFDGAKRLQPIGSFT